MASSLLARRCIKEKMVTLMRSRFGPHPSTSINKAKGYSSSKEHLSLKKAFKLASTLAIGTFAITIVLQQCDIRIEAKTILSPFLATSKAHLEENADHDEPLDNHSYLNSGQAIFPEPDEISEPSYPLIKQPYRIAASQISDVILKSKHAVFLEIFEDGCGACAQLNPVIHVIAEALQHADAKNIDVVQMEGEKNYRRGFLTLDDRRAVPVMKLFNQSTSTKYDDRPNAETILKWLHANLPPHASFDLEKAIAFAKQHDEEVAAEVRAKAQYRLSLDESKHLYDASPCGKQLDSWMTYMLSRSYLFDTPERDATEMNAMNELRTCLDTKQTEIQDYWRFVKQVAESNLDEADERDRNRKRKTKKNAAKQGSSS